MTARIRPARPADVEAMLELERHFPSDQVSRRAFLRFLRVPSARVLVVTEAGILLGYLILLLRKGAVCGRVYSVIVSPLARGRGLGDRLVAAAERIARQAGYAGLSLEVRVDNPAARRLYERRGYVCLRELTAYYEDGADGLRLRKRWRLAVTDSSSAAS